MKNPDVSTVTRFNILKGALLAWKHYKACENKEMFDQGVRDQLKHEFEAILKTYPNINEIMPEFWCAICNNKHVTK